MNRGPTNTPHPFSLHFVRIAQFSVEINDTRL